MPKPTRMRLDQLLVERGLAPTRNAARGLVMAGLVEVAGRVVDKAGAPTSADAELHVKERPRFVSRAGEKLAHALEVFGVVVRGRRALDVGASTGGFVDCLLQGGAAEVIALDVGHGQLDARLRSDPRVHVVERTNARYLTADLLPYTPDFLTADVSFISLEKILPAVINVMAPVFEAVVLVKPQFEAGPEKVRKGGVVRDPAVRRAVVLRFAAFAVEELGLELYGLADSGLPGTSGNREYVASLGRGGAKGLSLASVECDIEALLDAGERQPSHGGGDE